MQEGGDKPRPYVLLYSSTARLPANDPIDNGQDGTHGPWGVQPKALSIAVVQTAIEVAGHPPGGAIAVPVARPNERVPASCALQPSHRPEESHCVASREQRSRELRRPASPQVHPPCIGKLVSAISDRS